MNVGVEKQPMPKKGETEILPLVIEDLRSRGKISELVYGQKLSTFNGRDSLVDAYQEALDLCMYLRQVIEERNSDRSRA
jgi:hypothetical protein